MNNKYYLISKNIGQKFVEYKGNATKLGTHIPYTVDEIVVGVKGTLGKERKITTFRDSKGNIIERAFDFFDKPYKNRLYEYKDHIIGDSEFVESKTVKEYSLDRILMPVYEKYKSKLVGVGINKTLWEPEKIDTFHISENINNGEKVISRARVSNLKNPKKEVHTFIEYPHIIDGKKESEVNKFLSFLVNRNTNKVINESYQTENVTAPVQDNFLALRALDIDSAKEPMTRLFLKERGVSKLNVNIDTDYAPLVAQREKLCASTSFDDLSISYNKIHKLKSKTKLADIARHETEHVWQFYLNARNTGGDSAKTKMIARKYGKIKDKKLLEEAKSYEDPIKNYTFFNQDYQGYRDNYIEKCARQKGKEAAERYDKDGKSIRNSFPHIPKETL